MASAREHIVVGLLAAVTVLAFACGGDAERTDGPGPTLAPAIPQQRFRTVDFVDGQTGWFIGESEADGGGVILATTDGGATWQPQLSADGSFVGIEFSDPSNGILLQAQYDGRALRDNTYFLTTDGGESWTTAPDATEFDDPCRGATGNGWTIQQDGVVRRTDDGGGTWQESFTPPDELRRLNGTSIHCHGDDVVWIILKGGVAMHNMTHAVYRTLDGGKTWRPVLQHQVPGLGAPGSGPVPGPLRVVDESVAFFFSHCTPCNGFQDRIFRTTDGGITWDASVPIPNLGRVADAEFLDANHGWVVGRWYDSEDFRNLESYAVILATTDGGKTWVQQYPQDRR